MTEEARKAVEALRICHSNEDCRDCKFIDSDKDEMSCVNVLFVKAADLIESLSEQLEQVTKERDAAFRYIKRGCRACSACRYGDDTPENNEVCDKCIPNPEGYSEWQWEGVEVTDNAQKGSDAKS